MDLKVKADLPDTAPSGEPDAPERPDVPDVPGRRRIVITIFIVVTLGAVLVGNMPNSVIKGELMGVARPYLNATGLDQSWSIFSPNPRQVSIFITARIEHADGSVTVRPFPTGIGLSEYSVYRWQKYEETLSEPGGRILWRPYAEWAVGQDRREGGEPVRVTLVRSVSKNLPPGPQVDALPFVDEVFYTAPVSPR